MPVTLQPASLKYKNSQGTYQSADCIKGDTGATPNLTIGTVSTLAPGASATATLTGTAEAPVLNLGIPLPNQATSATSGTVKVSADYGLSMNNSGIITTYSAGENTIKAGADWYKPIVPQRQHYAAFYGLAKAAGADEKNSTEEFGTYTTTAKAAIRSMIGAAATSDIPSVPVQDVQVNGTSIVENNVASIPIMSTSQAGVAKYGTRLTMSGGVLSVPSASSSVIKAGSNASYVLTPDWTHGIAFYGLAKAAGSDEKNSTLSLGTYTEAAKSAIQTMLDVVSKSAIDNTGITAKSYTTKFGGEFSVTTATNANYISPYARASVTGRIGKAYLHKVTFNGTEYTLKTRLWYSINTLRTELKVYEYLGNLGLYVSDTTGIPDGTDNVPFVIISDLNNSESIDVLTETAGTYTIKVEQISYTKSVLPRPIIYGDAYEPILKNNNGGTYNGFSIGVNELNNKRATIALGYGNKIEAEFSDAIGAYNTVNSGCPSSHLIGQDNTANGSAAYAFGDMNRVSHAYAIGLSNDATNSGVALGRVNDANKGYCLGTGLKSKYNATVVGMNNVDLTAITHAEWAANTAYAVDDIVHVTINGTDIGVYKCLTAHTSSSSFITDFTKWKDIKYESDTAFLVGNGFANDDRKNGFKVTMTGDGRFGGDVYVNCNADSSGGTMLPKDVQVNGTSVVTNGVANIPQASGSNLGAVKVQDGTYGLRIYHDSGNIGTFLAQSAEIKAGTNVYKPIVPYMQHESVFYGLTKAAGVDMASSSNAVGTYTTEAKSAIRTMLGIETKITLIETISSTTPSIIGQPNVRYNCGEVSTINITPPANGTIDVFFTSGSTAAVLTVPNTVKFPSWFDVNTLDSNTIYELMITDAIYGSVMVWES